MSGLSSFLVTRKQANVPDVPFRLSPTNTGMYDSGLQPATAYTYHIEAVYPDGSIGSTDVQFTTPPTVNPTGLTAQLSAPGQVLLSWQPVNGAAYYRVIGSGSASSGVRVVDPVSKTGVVSYVVTGVPAGTHEFVVGSFYEPGAVSSPSAAFSRATLDVPATPAPVVSGNYLITITGLRAVWASADDVLSRDGKGDEVYVKTYIRKYDRRNGGVVEFFQRGTLTYGDVNGFGTSRVQAGTSSQSGGIRDGDPIPANSDPTSRSANPLNTAFPLRLFEGTLTNGIDALVFSPTLWEEDGGNEAYLIWSQQMDGITSALFQRPEIQNQITKGTFEPILFGTSATPGMSDAVWTASLLTNGATLAGLTGGASLVYQAAQRLFAGPTDRPIGLIPSGVADVNMVLPNSMVVLTREIIEAALAPLPAGTAAIGPPFWPRFPKPGLMMIPFHDGPQSNMLGPVRPAYYEMYLKVERIP
jgi:hypothetical protein